MTPITIASPVLKISSPRTTSTATITAPVM